MSGSGSEDRTEAPTAQRLTRARAEGNVPVSRDLTGLAGLLAATMVLMMAGPTLGAALAVRLQGFLANLQAWPATGALPWDAAATAILAAAAPIVLAVLAAGCGAALLQTGFLLNLAALKPKFSRISPGAGIKRLLSPDHLMETAKSLVKALALSFGAWNLMSAQMGSETAALGWNAQQLLAAILADILHLLLYLIGAQAAITTLDLLWVRVRHAGRLRMSRTEIKDEHRESDGDPRIKARLRQIRHARMRRRMLAAVPQATLVVTNPTHYAIALIYQRGQPGAPRVVAKGVDEVAARIREVAQANRVPIMASPPLARALYLTELDQEIPAEHFQTVAELIAYVWRLQTRAEPRIL